MRFCRLLHNELQITYSWTVQYVFVSTAIVAGKRQWHDLCNYLLCCHAATNCPRVLCLRHCPYGFVYDENKCQTCECYGNPCAVRSFIIFWLLINNNNNNNNNREVVVCQLQLTNCPVAEYLWYIWYWSIQCVDNYVQTISLVNITHVLMLANLQ